MNSEECGTESHYERVCVTKQLKQSSQEDGRRTEDEQERIQLKNYQTVKISYRSSA